KLETGNKACESVCRFWADPGIPRCNGLPPSPVLPAGSALESRPRVQAGIRLVPEACEFLGGGRGELGIGEVGSGPVIALLRSPRLAQVMLAHRQEDPPPRPVQPVRVCTDRLLEQFDGLGTAALAVEDHPEVTAIGEVRRVAAL